MVSCWSSIIINDAATVNDAKELLEGSMLETIKRLSKAVSSLVLGRNLDDRDSATVSLLSECSESVHPYTWCESQYLEAS
jgi:hypothetical protein